MSTLLIDVVDENGKPANPDMSPLQRIASIFPSPGSNFGQETPHRSAITNIYKTKDGRCYHVHGNNYLTERYGPRSELGLITNRQYERYALFDSTGFRP